MGGRATLIARRRRSAGPLLWGGLLTGVLLMVVPVGLWLVGTGPSAHVPAGGPPSAAAAAMSGPGPGTSPTPVAATGSVAAPTRIRMPGVGVDAVVLPVGVDPAGQMAVPPDVRSVGWYRFGPGPGDPVGSSVLAGHVDDRVQGHGAFYRLADLTAGEPVLVTLADGSQLRFRVRSVERIGKATLPVQQLFDRSGPPQLTLITCGGEFDRTARRFRDNVVVVADPG